MSDDSENSDILNISAVDRMKVFLASGDTKLKLKTAAREKVKKQKAADVERVTKSKEKNKVCKYSTV